MDKVKSLQEMPRKIPWHLFIVFFILSVAIALTGYYFYRDQREHIKTGKQQELSAIADLKVKQIQNWRNERIRDASFIFNNAEIADQIENLQKHPSSPEVKQNKLSWMTAMYKNLQYKNMCIVSNQGGVLVSIPEKTPSISSYIKAHLSEAIKSNKIIFSDLYKDEMQNIFMHMIVPIFIARNDRKVNVGAVMLWIDPREFLYPLIQSWPTPSATAETLLVGRKGDSVVFLNELRHRKNTALTLRFPITEKKLPAAMVVRGIKGVVQGTDYRGIEVLAEIRPVPDSPWFLVAKVDMEEAFHPYTVSFRILVILVFVLIISAGLSISLFWRHQQAQFYRKQHETELQRFALLQKYEYLTRQANDIILILDREGNIMEANERAAASYRYTQDELLRLNVRDLRSPDTLASVEEQLKRLEEQSGIIFETVHKRKEGATFPVEVSSRMISLDGNKFILSIIRDITERKRAEEALLEKEHLLSESQRIAHIGTWSWHVATGAISWSPETYRIYGVSEETFILSPETFLGLIHPDDRAAMQAWISACLAGEKPEDLEFRIILSDGRVRFINGRGDLQCDAENRPVRMIGTAQDITERKIIEESLRYQQELLNETGKIAKVGGWEFDPVSLKGTWTEEVALIHDLDPEVNTNVELGLSYYQGEFRTKIEKAVKEAIELEKPYDLELEIITAKGNRKWVRTIGHPVIKNGKVVKVRGSFQDITERKQAYEALHKSEEELYDSYTTQALLNMILGESLENIPLELILQKALNMMVSIPWFPPEAKGSILLVEDRPDVLVMKARSNMDKTLCSDIPFGKCLCGQAALTQKIEFSDRIDERHGICREDKCISSREHYAVPILYGGKTQGVLNIYLEEGRPRDRKLEAFLHSIANTLAGIIERKKMEHDREILQAQLLQAQKMEAIGQLAGGISHDFNNILTAIIGYTHLLKIKMKEDDPLISYPDSIIMLSEKAANLTQSLLAFSRKQLMNPRPINLNEIVRTVEKLLFRIIGEDIRLQTAPFEKDLIVKVDHGQIEQVLMNLATNARDSMPGGGRLTITTEPIDIDHEFINEHGFGKEGKYAVMSVIDTGTGMDKETKEKIFEPFFTTKEVGKGTGLGLAMVYGIIRQHEGYINVYSEPGKGTAFRIYLPLIEGKADEGTPEEIQTAERGTETILLAEDETEVRVFVKRLLEEYGYKAIEAIDGQDAIDRFYMHKDKIQFLLLDVIMPKKNGREVYEEIKKITPGIKVLFTSGYPADHINGIVEKGIEFILKPISPIKLLIKIREILDK